MGRLIIPALVAVALLSGCSSEGDATTPTPSPTTSSATPTTPPEPTPPVMPEAAKAHTEAGAKAFVKYFWEVVDYASINLDPAAVRALIGPGCPACDGGVASIEETRDKGGRITGGATTVRITDSAHYRAGDHRLATVKFIAKSTQQTVDYPGTKNDKIFPADRVRMTMFLDEVPAGWRVGNWEIHQ